MPGDRELVEDFLKTRSDKAFRELYREKTPPLYQMALRLTAFNEFNAQELTQEMWVTAIRKLDTFQWKSSLKTWLIGILINLNRDETKRTLSKKKALDGFSELSGVKSTTSSGHDLELALSKLPIGYRTVIILHDIEGYQHNEIAVLLNIKEGTSKSQLFQARKALKQQLISKKQM